MTRVAKLVYIYPTKWIEDWGRLEYDLKPLAIRSYGATYWPLLVLQHNGWSTQKGMIPFQGV